MNFDEAKDYLYNRYKNSFRYVDDAFMYKQYYVFKFSCNYMTPFVYDVFLSEDNCITWNTECDRINHYDSDDVIERKLKKIKKYIDDVLKTIYEINKKNYEINKKNLIQKLNNL